MRKPNAIGFSSFLLLERRLQLLGRDQQPGLAQMGGEFMILDAIQKNSYPTAHADIRRPEKLLRFRFDQRSLHAERRRTPDGDPPVVVVIVGEHRKDLLTDKESRFAVRDFFRHFGQRQTKTPDSFEMIPAHNAPYHNPNSFHQTKPITVQIKMFTHDAIKPSRHQSRWL